MSRTPAIIACAASAGLLANAPNRAAQPEPELCGPWVAVEHDEPEFSPARFEDLVVIAPDDIWAVGQEWEEDAARRTVTMHYDGQAWTRIPSPSPGPSYADGTQCWLYSVDATSSDNVYAVGVYSPADIPGNQPLVLHWDGQQWTHLADAPVNFGNGLTGLVPTHISIVGPDEFWLSAHDAASDAPMIHYDSGSWEVVYADKPPINGYAGTHCVSGIAPDDVWAVGGVGSLGPPSTAGFAAHYDGASWTSYFFDSPGALPYILTDVEMVATDDVWASGKYRDDNNVYHPWLMHWDGASWTHITAIEPDAWPRDMHAIATDDIWSVNGGQLTHWDGQSWKILAQTPDGAVLPSLLGVGGLDACGIWAVGQSVFGPDATTLIARIDPTMPPTNPADLNNDNIVDSLDLNLVLGAFGKNDPAGDANGDGLTDATDLNIILAQWG